MIRNNYGPLGYDHTNILNLTYNWALPTFIHSDTAGMKILGGAVNGWKISGYTAFQSGAPYQPTQGANMNTTFATTFRATLPSGFAGQQHQATERISGQLRSAPRPGSDPTPTTI